MRQYSLLVRGGRCTNATHIFYVQCNRQLGVFKILNAYERINVHARRPPPEARRAR